MRLLLDTQVLYLWMLGSSRLPTAIDASIADDRNHVVISTASIWEMAIKHAKGRLPLPDGALEELLTSEFRVLVITPRHSITAAALPPHHADPFDRMLIAQAQAEGLTLVGSDEMFAVYGVTTLWE